MPDELCDNYIFEVKALHLTIPVWMPMPDELSPLLRDYQWPFGKAKQILTKFTHQLIFVVYDRGCGLFFFFFFFFFSNIVAHDTEYWTEVRAYAYVRRQVPVGGNIGIK